MIEYNADTKMQRIDLIAREIANSDCMTNAIVPPIIHLLAIACLARDESDDVRAAVGEAGRWLRKVGPETGDTFSVASALQRLGVVFERIAGGERMGVNHGG